MFFKLLLNLFKKSLSSVIPKEVKLLKKLLKGASLGTAATQTVQNSVQLSKILNIKNVSKVKLTKTLIEIKKIQRNKIISEKQKQAKIDRLLKSVRKQLTKAEKSKTQRVNKFQDEELGFYRTTNFVNSPNSWLNSMFIDKFGGNAVLFPKKGKPFNVHMNTSIFGAMARSISPGRVLWNTAWLHKRRFRTTRLGKRELNFRQFRRNSFRQQHVVKNGIWKYYQINRKW